MEEVTQGPEGRCGICSVFSLPLSLQKASYLSPTTIGSKEERERDYGLVTRIL